MSLLQSPSPCWAVVSGLRDAEAAARMLKQRVITALVLLAILLPALLAAQPWPFALMALAFIAAAGWEWARLSGWGGVPAWGTGALLFAAGVWALLPTLQAAANLPVPAVGVPAPDLPLPGWGLVGLGWLAGGVWMLRRGIARWHAVPRGLRWLVGVLVLAVTWMALMQARRVGLNFLLSVFCLAWAADIAAYFGGRAFGRRKLAPSISPGKSWEGVWSGMAGAGVLAGLWIAFDRAWAPESLSLYSLVLTRLGLPALLLSVPALAAMTVVGDLCESVVKRVAGAKDSSHLLPGHGGVLDRIDALLPLLPLAWALAKCAGV